MDVAAKLRQLNIELPAAPPPAGSYAPVVVSGNLAFVSGQIARSHRDGAILYRGKVGDTVSPEQGATVAREAILAALAALRAEGLLDRVARVVKLTGFIAAAPNFMDHPKVMNGASDLLLAVWGDAGRHARTTIGVATLPLGASVEVEAIFELGE